MIDPTLCVGSAIRTLRAHTLTQSVNVGVTTRSVGTINGASFRDTFRPQKAHFLSHPHHPESPNPQHEIDRKKALCHQKFGCYVGNIL
jgi:hypothetical protein